MIEVETGERRGPGGSKANEEGEGEQGEEGKDDVETADNRGPEGREVEKVEPIGIEKQGREEVKAGEAGRQRKDEMKAVEEGRPEGREANEEGTGEKDRSVKLAPPPTKKNRNLFGNYGLFMGSRMAQEMIFGLFPFSKKMILKWGGC